MGPEYWKPGVPTALKKCSERVSNSCTDETDGCCAVIACSYCLEWNPDYGQTKKGFATFFGTYWSGSVAGATWIGRWEREILPDVTPPLSANSAGMSFAPIAGGTYMMGSPGSETGRLSNEDQVSKTVEAFNIGTTEVTQAQYLAVRGLSPSHFAGSGRPVEMVSYSDALAFCSTLSARPSEIAMGRTYRLPTEAEWEWACRAGTTTAYSFGANPVDLPTYGWFEDNSGAETHDVSLKSPNTSNLYDMHGNVWEWAQNDQLDAVEGEQVIRGGGWDSTAAQCRSASRQTVAETTKANNIGFRVVMMQAPIPQLGDCEFVVTFDEDEVYRKSCEYGQSCRDSSDSADDYSYCKVHYCDDCECTCEELCVDVREVLTYGYSDFIDTYEGTLANTAYPCDPPVWEGTVGSFDLSLALGHDEYGACVITPTVNGYDQPAIPAPGCADMEATLVLEDGSEITVRCKKCDCPDGIGDCICGRPMGPILRVVWSSGNGTHGSASRTFDLTYGMVDEPTISCSPWSPNPFPGYRGSVSGTFPIPMGGTRADTLEVILVCECTGCQYCIYYRWVNDDAYPTWQVVPYTILTCDCPAVLDVIGGFTEGNVWGYQVSDVMIYELEDNC
jgi:formylglycine-generating enzyme required for sulfatase activity